MFLPSLWATPLAERSIGDQGAPDLYSDLPEMYEVTDYKLQVWQKDHLQQGGPLSKIDMKIVGFLFPSLEKIFQHQLFNDKISNHTM